VGLRPSGSSRFIRTNGPPRRGACKGCVRRCMRANFAWRGGRGVARRRRFYGHTVERIDIGPPGTLRSRTRTGRSRKKSEATRLQGGEWETFIQKSLRIKEISQPKARAGTDRPKPPRATNRPLCPRQDASRTIPSPEDGESKGDGAAHKS